MRIFDETKTREMQTFNPQEGYLRQDELIIHHEAVPEKIIKTVEDTVEELKGEGKEVNFRADGNYYVVTNIVYNDEGERVGNEEDLIEPALEEGKDAWDETEEIKVYIPYTEKEKAEMEIASLKQKLFQSDYKAIKFAEGYLSEEEYAPVKAERQAWRDRINEIEQSLL